MSFHLLASKGAANCATHGRAYVCADASVGSSGARIHNRSITKAGWFDSLTSSARIRNVILQLLYHNFVIYFDDSFTALFRYACSNLAKPMVS